MGVKERRLRDKIRRSNEIIDAAESVIFAKGIQNATMDDIAQEAELGKATLYGYYAGKDEILLAIQQRAMDKLANAFEQAADTRVLGYDKIRAIGEAYFRFAIEFPNYYKFVSLFEATNTSIDPEKTHQNVLKVNILMQQAIKIGITDGSVRADLRPEVLSKMLWAVSTGVMQMINVKGDVLKFHAIEAQELFECFFEVMSAGLALKNSF
jgi:AcrR family transcriptional regulator